MLMIFLEKNFLIKLIAGIAKSNAIKFYLFCSNKILFILAQDIEIRNASIFPESIGDFAGIYPNSELCWKH